MAEMTNKEHKETQITSENIHLFKDLDIVAWSYSPDCMATIWIIDSDGNLVLKATYDNLWKGYGLSFANSEEYKDTKNPYYF